MYHGTAVICATINKNNDDSATCGAAVKLSVGDQVQVVNKFNQRRFHRGEGGGYSLFTGALLHRDA